MLYQGFVKQWHQIEINVQGLKGHCHDIAHVWSWLNPFVLTNRNRNTITSATIAPRVSLEFHAPFENILIRWLLIFCLQRIFIMFMLCEGRVRTSYFSTIFDSKSKICRLNISLLTVFPFFTNRSVGKEIKLLHTRRRVSNALSLSVDWDVDETSD